MCGLTVNVSLLQLVVSGCGIVLQDHVNIQQIGAFRWKLCGEGTLETSQSQSTLICFQASNQTLECFCPTRRMDSPVLRRRRPRSRPASCRRACRSAASLLHHWDLSFWCVRKRIKTGRSFCTWTNAAVISVHQPSVFLFSLLRWLIFGLAFVAPSFLPLCISVAGVARLLTPQPENAPEVQSIQYTVYLCFLVSWLS